ncbi:MAG: F0F1 ATP synthase subunit A [Nitrospirae bacterium]|nr:F0F1 ATP synthase subunit A [Nitrospirota bacterium]
MTEHHPFTWIDHIPGITELPENTVTFGFVTLVLGGIAVGIHAMLEREGDPTKLPTRRGAFLVLHVVRMLRNFLRGLIGHEGDKHVPFIGSLFLAILLSNLLGLIPGFLPPTQVFATNIGLAVLSFVYYNVVGIRAHGWRYIKQFTGPVIYLAPMLLLIELFSHVVRPVTLTIRLMANIFADHTAFEIFSGLVPIVVPAAILMLGTLVSIIQAFVFALLSAVYIGLAVSHEH